MTKQTQHAVALRYENQKDQAPCVIAKGSGYIAEKIIQAASQHGIPLVSDPVAGQLLSQVDIGTEITPEFYQAIAEILAFVYQLNRMTKAPTPDAKCAANGDVATAVI
jgi:flagellar biosynthesis protein